jgi:hypothetical protein
LCLLLAFAGTDAEARDFCRPSKLRARQLSFSCDDVARFAAKQGQWRRSEANAIAAGFPRIVDVMTYQQRMDRPPEIEQEFMERLLGPPTRSEPLAESRRAVQPAASRLGKKARKMKVLTYDSGCTLTPTSICWDLFLLVDDELVVAAWTLDRAAAR